MSLRAVSASLSIDGNIAERGRRDMERENREAEGSKRSLRLTRLSQHAVMRVAFHIVASRSLPGRRIRSRCKICANPTIAGVSVTATKFIFRQKYGSGTNNYIFI